MPSLKLPTVRFFAGDAVAFPHALHQLNALGISRLGEIYRDAYHLSPIEFESEEYGERCGPLQFSVIDTSNLIDHLGALLILLATYPLLKDGLTSILYTDSLVKRRKEYKAYIESLLWGQSTTISLLLGLFTVE